MPEETTPKTRSVSETGHAKNLENMKKKRDFAASWGADYDPTNPILKLDFVNTRIADAEAVADELQSLREPYRAASNAAEDAFAPLSELMTRVERGFKVSGVPSNAVDDLKTYTRKIKGTRKASGKSGNADNGVVEKGHSVSQMSRISRIENLDSAITLLVEYGFKPNEVELKTETLSTYSADLKTKTEAVSQTYVPVSNKLDTRDQIYYLAEDSLYKISRGMEDYTVSRFGTSSNQYNQIRDLEVTLIKRKKDR